MNFLLVVAVYVLSVYVFFKDEIKAIKDRDPAAKNSLEIILLYSGLHAIVFYRIAHKLWEWKLPFVPRAMSQVAKFLTGIEIHPGAVIGHGLFIDHGMGVVIGETTIIGNNVTMFQGSTLGGTGKETGKRHPTVGDNVVIGAGAKVLGNITIGSNTYVGANAVVIKNVPHNATVVGVPAHIVKQGGKKLDELLDHAHVSDPVMQNITKLLKRIKVVEEKIGDRDQGAEI
jgi:serine O-acetyltransferase